MSDYIKFMILFPDEYISIITILIIFFILFIFYVWIIHNDEVNPFKPLAVTLLVSWICSSVLANLIYYDRNQEAVVLKGNEYIKEYGKDLEVEKLKYLDEMKNNYFYVIDGNYTKIPDFMVDGVRLDILNTKQEKLNREEILNITNEQKEIQKQEILKKYE